MGLPFRVLAGPNRNKVYFSLLPEFKGSVTINRRSFIKMNLDNLAGWDKPFPISSILCLHRGAGPDFS